MKGGVRDMARAAGLTKPQTEHSETTHPENHRVTESTIARYLISGYNHPRLRVGFFFHETSSKKDKKEKKVSPGTKQVCTECTLRRDQSQLGLASPRVASRDQKLVSWEP